MLHSRHIIPTLKTTRSIQTSCSTQIHYPSSKTTRSRQTSCSTQIHYPNSKTPRSRQTSCSTQTHYPNSKTTRSRQTSRSTQTQYPNSKTTSLCSFSLMLFLYPECSNTNVSLWFDTNKPTLKVNMIILLKAQE